MASCKYERHFSLNQKYSCSEAFYVHLRVCLGDNIIQTHEARCTVSLRSCLRQSSLCTVVDSLRELLLNYRVVLDNSEKKIGLDSIDSKHFCSSFGTFPASKTFTDGQIKQLKFTPCLI